MVMYDTVRLQPHAYYVDHQQHCPVQVHTQQYKRTCWWSSANTTPVPYIQPTNEDQRRAVIVIIVEYLDSTWTGTITTSYCTNH